MALSTSVKDLLNTVLAPANLRLETLTARRREEQRIRGLTGKGHFEQRVFPVLPGFETADIRGVLGALPQFRSRFDTFRDESANEVGFSFANDYFPSPDAEVLYAMVRLHQPSRILEIGSGNSTRIIRQATRDGKMRSALVSVDPQPRRQVLEFADRWIESRIEDCDMGLFDLLSSGDILFIDSSHEVSTGNDGAVLYGAVLPRLARGVLVHIHDIFIPYEYPIELRNKGAWNWNEQYVVQAILANGGAFEVLWPSYYLHKSCEGLSKAFPYSHGRPGQSLWLRKVAESTLAR